MAVTDVYKAVVHATYLGKSIQNRYYYQQTLGSTLLAGGLNSAMRDDLIPVLATIQHQNLVYDRIEIVNLSNPADFGVFTGIQGETGDRTGTTSPSFNCWTFKLFRSTRNIRNGRKAIAGVSEDDTTGNDPTAGIQVVLDAVANIFWGPLTNITNDTYVPLLVRETAGVVTYQEPVSNAAFQRLSTQSSRK